MPVVTITSVNTGTEELTAVGHGLLTGDRFRVRNVGGALPAATPALAGATDYFAVRTGVDTLKMSDTNAHALAGTGIVNLTGSGSGTNLIEYGLPYCVPRIAANGTQIFPEDDNAAWTSLVALYELLTGQGQSIWDGVTLAGALAAAGLRARSNNANYVELTASAALAASYTVKWPPALPVSGRAWLAVDSTGAISLSSTLETYASGLAISLGGPTFPTGTNEVWTMNPSGKLSLPLRLPVGTTFASWKVYMNVVGTRTYSAQLRQLNMATNTFSNVGSAVTVALTGTQSLTGPGTTVLADCHYSITLTETGGAGGAGDTMLGWSVDV